jgi:transposase-like protein
MRVQAILNQYQFSADTLKKVQAKKTEKGAIAQLCTREAFIEVFDSDEKVFSLMFEAMRKKADDTCICGEKIGRNFKRLTKRKFKCTKCKRIISPLANTPMKGMHFKLHKFLELAYWTYNSKQGYSTAELARQLNWRYDTALPLRHRMNVWMGMALNYMKFLPEIPIEVDEVFPRIPSGLPKDVPRTKGLGSEGIDPHLVMSQRGPGGLVKVEHLPEVTKNVIKPIFESSISTGSIIYTDGKFVYNFLKEEDYFHFACNHSAKLWADGPVHVNTAEGYNGIAKNQIMHHHNGVSEAHITGYMSDAAWSFSHRFKDVYEAIDSLLDALPSLNDKPINGKK